MSEYANYFANLESVECQTDKKGKLTYISWIEAWSALKRIHPGATYEVHQTPDGRFLHGEGLVMCSVTVPGVEGHGYDGVTHTMWLPVMDHQNRAIPEPDTTQINKALMRCLAKCVAMHGLGAYVYMGEDLPVVSEAPQAAPKQANGRPAPPLDAEVQALLVERLERVHDADADTLNRWHTEAKGWPESAKRSIRAAIAEEAERRK